MTRKEFEQMVLELASSRYAMKSYPLAVHVTAWAIFDKTETEQEEELDKGWQMFCRPLTWDEFCDGVTEYSGSGDNSPTELLPTIKYIDNFIGESDFLNTEDFTIWMDNAVTIGRNDYLAKRQMMT